MLQLSTGSEAKQTGAGAFQVASVIENTERPLSKRGYDGIVKEAQYRIFQAR